jgi:5'-3' exonuclease
MKDMFDINHSPEVLEEASKDLRDMMAKSINIILNRFKEIDNVVVISDGGSWRKQLPIPDQLQNVKYKGNREDEKTTDVAWDYIYKALSGLCSRCREMGITTSTQNNIEGDDWAWYWSRRLNSQGVNCIIWTSDKDLMQLVQNKNGVFTAWYNDKSGMIFHESIQDKNPQDDDLDFFMQPIVLKNPLIDKLCSRSTQSSYINPNTIITSKVICGDSGDNIKSVVRILKNNRCYGVSERDWSNISGELSVVTIQDLINKKQEVAESIFNLKKFRGHPITVEGIKEMIDYNIKLVWLNEDVIPDTIISTMNTQEYKVVNVNELRGSYKTLCDVDKEIENIFSGVNFL